MTKLTESTTNQFGTSTRVTDLVARTVKSTGVDGIVSTETFNQYGETTQTKHATFAPTVNSYDSRGRVVSSTTGSGTPDAATTTWTYDGAFIATETNPAGQLTTYTVDGVGRVLSVTRPGGSTRQHGYDGRGRLTAVTPPGKPTHTIGLSTGGRMLSYDAPVSPGVERQFSYNADSLSTGVRNGDGTTTTFGHDAAGRLTNRPTRTGPTASSATPVHG